MSYEWRGVLAGAYANDKAMSRMVDHLVDVDTGEVLCKRIKPARMSDIGSYGQVPHCPECERRATKAKEHQVKRSNTTKRSGKSVSGGKLTHVMNRGKIVGTIVESPNLGFIVTMGQDFKGFKLFDTKAEALHAAGVGRSKSTKRSKTKRHTAKRSKIAHRLRRTLRGHLKRTRARISKRLRHFKVGDRVIAGAGFAEPRASKPATVVAVHPNHIMVRYDDLPGTYTAIPSLTKKV